MQVIITMAGHSRRFQQAGHSKPKFLLEIGGQPMLAGVVDMFDTADTFHFVVNSHQMAEYPEIREVCRQAAKHAVIHVIEPHELGPVHSAMQVSGIPEDAPVIVTYCDFFVEWDYVRFKREVVGYAAAVPAFRGFHPASFGHTYYAYMRVNEAKEMLELREKRSFTEQRHEEPASTGIYYFRTWDTFRHYAGGMMSSGEFEGLREGYVSLLLNPMVKDGLKVKVTEVDKFICLGTPEDVRQYEYWSRYFGPSAQLAPKRRAAGQANLVPMAGSGSRFRRFGFRTSKPLINVRGEPMVVRASKSFPSAERWVFLPLGDDLRKRPLIQVLESVDPSARIAIVRVPEVTACQAATCLLAKDQLDPGRPVFIASCDYETLYDEAAWQALIADEDIDGAIWTCGLPDSPVLSEEAVTYCETELGTNLVAMVVEDAAVREPTASGLLAVGSFWFRRAEDFWTCAEEAASLSSAGNAEQYFGLFINRLIAGGKKFVVFPIEQRVSFGDPFELQVLEYWEAYFLKH